MKEIFKGFRNHFTQNYYKFPEPLSQEIFSWKTCKPSPFLIPHIIT